MTNSAEPTSLIRTEATSLRADELLPSAPAGGPERGVGSGHLSDITGAAAWRDDTLGNGQAGTKLSRPGESRNSGASEIRVERSRRARAGLASAHHAVRHLPSMPTASRKGPATPANRWCVATGPGMACGSGVTAGRDRLKFPDGAKELTPASAPPIAPPRGGPAVATPDTRFGVDGSGAQVDSNFSAYAAAAADCSEGGEDA